MRIDQFIAGAAVDRLTDVLLLVGLDGSILDANDRALECYGYSRPEMLALSIRDLRAADVSGDIDQQMAAAAASGVVFETEHRRSDGRVVPVEVRSAAVTVDGESALFSVVRDISCAREAVDALSDREWRLASIIEGTNVGTWEWNVKTGEMIFNHTWAELVGYTLEELAPCGIGTWERLVHPDDRRRSDEILARHFAGELPIYDCECRMLHRSGEWVWVRDRGRVITRDDRGDPIMMFGTHVDITERKRSEQELRESEERSRAIISASPVPMVSGDADGNIGYVNPAFTRTFGYTSADIPSLGDWWSRAYPDAAYRQQVSDAWLAALDETTRTGTPFAPMEVTVACKDGSSRTVLASAAPFSDTSGANQLVVLYDITHRKGAEEALRASEERYRSILEASPDGIMITDLDAHVLIASPKVRTLLGLTQEQELVGRSFTEFVVAEDRVRTLADLARLTQGVKDGPGVYGATGVDGRAFDMEVTGDLIRDADGLPVKMVFIVRDVTERQRSADALSVSEARLQAMFDQAPMGIALVESLTGRLIQVNATFARIAGRSIDEMGALDWMSITHPDDMQTDLDNMALVNAGEMAGFQKVKRYIRGDGSTVWISMTVAPLQVGDEEGPRHLCMIQDITADREVQQELLSQKERIGQTLSSVIDMASNIVETRDPYTAGHQRRVAELAERLARELGMSMIEVADIRVAGLIHDVGKIKVPAEILGKPGPISPAEYAILKDHPETGYRILTSASMEPSIAELVYQHHERCDGTGYPRGLTGKEMLAGAKVLAVADVVEAMMSNRPYRPALGIDAALAEIERGAGGIYDARVSQACVGLFRDQHFELKSVSGEVW